MLRNITRKSIYAVLNISYSNSYPIVALCPTFPLHFFALHLTHNFTSYHYSIYTSLSYSFHFLPTKKWLFYLFLRYYPSLVLSLSLSCHFVLILGWFVLLFFTDLFWLMCFFGCFNLPIIGPLSLSLVTLFYFIG